MLIYETNLANVDPAKATRATLGNPILYLFLENHKIFWYFYLHFNKVPYFSSAAKMYSLDICSLKLITISKFIGRIFAKLNNIIHDNKERDHF